MSARLILTADDLRHIAKALDSLTEIANQRAVFVGVGGAPSITYRDDEGRETVLALGYTQNADGDFSYILDDLIGG